MHNRTKIDQAFAAVRFFRADICTHHTYIYAKRMSMYGKLQHQRAKPSRGGSRVCAYKDTRECTYAKSARLHVTKRKSNVVSIVCVRTVYAHTKSSKPSFVDL